MKEMKTIFPDLVGVSFQYMDEGGIKRGYEVRYIHNWRDLDRFILHIVERYEEFLVEDVLHLRYKGKIRELVPMVLHEKCCDEEEYDDMVRTHPLMGWKTTIPLKPSGAYANFNPDETKFL